jgi:uncharacterized membrane protein
MSDEMDMHESNAGDSEERVSARLILGFFVLMMGVGVVLDTAWNAGGIALALVGAALIYAGATTRR